MSLLFTPPRKPHQGPGPEPPQLPERRPFEKIRPRDDHQKLGHLTPETPDVHEVANYVNALEYGLARVKDLPISLRLIKETHEKLMRGVRGGTMTPGEFRRSQNWIGPPSCVLMDATFVPPPVDEMTMALGELEKYLHTPFSLPPLVRSALIHYQFEAIHPFLDGNGRIGRLLLTLR
jgi:Fic family protein